MTFERFLIQILNHFSQPRSPRPTGRDLVLGSTTTGGRRSLIILREAARPTHLAVMGLSGVGKTYFLEHLVRQDVHQKSGFVVFDVHGDLADALIAFIAEKSKKDDALADRLVIVEPHDPERSAGFNPLQRSDDVSPFMQTQELAHILRSRWETKTFGPRTEELLRSSLFTLSAHGLTLLELPLLLRSPEYRFELVRGLAEPAIVDFWMGRYDRLSEPMKAAVREPLLTRISAFLADPQIRHIVGQEKSTFTFRDAIAKGLFVIINLSKGRLGENSSILGSLFFTKLVLDVLAQASTPESQRKPFTIYADELQNLAGENFSTLIAEARKYRISVVAGNQFWRQLTPEMRAAMLGVGNRVFFRLNHHDANELAGELDSRERQWFASLLTRLPRGTAIFRSGDAEPQQFSVPSHPASSAPAGTIREIKERSLSKYARPRSQINLEIRKRADMGALPHTTYKLNRPGSQPDEPRLHP
jgi:hypothetical protein